MGKRERERANYWNIIKRAATNKKVIGIHIGILWSDVNYYTMIRIRSVYHTKAKSMTKKSKGNCNRLEIPAFAIRYETDKPKTNASEALWIVMSDKQTNINIEVKKRKNS